jgi:hypothetical protein
LEICRRHDFIQREARIHCKLAEFTFTTGDFEKAMQEADFSINKDPDNLKVYNTANFETINMQRVFPL